MTVSGPAEVVTELVAQPKAENAFAREVNSVDVAFHSRHLQEALEKVGPALLCALHTPPLPPPSVLVT